jgi:hypothetical protein
MALHLSFFDDIEKRRKLSSSSHDRALRTVLLLDCGISISHTRVSAIMILVSEAEQTRYEPYEAVCVFIQLSRKYWINDLSLRTTVYPR